MKLFKSKTVISTLRESKLNFTRKNALAKPKLNKENTDEVISFAQEQIAFSQSNRY